jgi:hypothetical protein
MSAPSLAAGSVPIHTRPTEPVPSHTITGRLIDLPQCELVFVWEILTLPHAGARDARSRPWLAPNPSLERYRNAYD